MRTDIPQDFADAIEDGSRWRGHYLVFHWPDGDQYIADDDGIEYAPGLFCDRLVADWGTLTDSIDVEAAISGTGSQTRQFDVSVVNTSDTGWWASKFAAHPPENMEVDLYHAVDGAAAVLVGRFVVQSPIEDDETSGVVRLTMLSVNQAYDPYVGTLDPINQQFYPLVVGAMAGVPGTPYGSHPVAKLDGDIEAGATTIKTDRPVSPAGFPTSGQLIIDFDVITYTGVNGVYFTGCSSVLAHSSGQYVFKRDHEYLFAFGAGPVDFAGPVYVDGAAYTGPHTIYRDRNPVQVGFLNEYPNKRVDSRTYGTAEKELLTLSPNTGIPSVDGVTHPISVSNNAVRIEIGRTQWNGNNITLTSSMGLDFPAGAILIAGKSYLSIRMIRATWPNGRLVDVKLSFKVAGVTRTYSSTGNKVLSFPLNDISDCSASKNSIVFKAQATGDYEVLQFEYMAHVYQWYMWADYYVDAFGYPKKEHFDNPSINIGQPGAKANPADLIASLLAKMERSTNIDSTSFASCRAWFGTAGYGMAGFLDGGLRCSEALKDICWQSRSFLVWDADKVYLRIRYPLSATPIVYASFLSNRREGSIKRRRQDFTLGSSRLGDPERQDGVVNALTVRYQRDIDGNFAARVDVTRADSIGKIGRAEGIRDAYLVPDAAYAASLANFWLGETCWPQDIITFSGVLIDGLLDVQLGDAVALSTDWSGIGYFTGRIASIRRTLAQNSSGKADEWELIVAGVVEEQLRVNLPATFAARSFSFGTRGPLVVALAAALEMRGAISAILTPVIKLYGVVKCRSFSFGTRGPLVVVLDVARMAVRAQDLVTRALGGFGYGKMGEFFWGW